jgi:hypothetical protein
MLITELKYLTHVRVITTEQWQILTEEFLQPDVNSVSDSSPFKSCIKPLAFFCYRYQDLILFKLH